MLRKNLNNNKKILLIILVLSLAIIFVWTTSSIPSVHKENSEVHHETQHAEGHAEASKHESSGHGEYTQAQLLTPEVSSAANLPVLIIFLPILGSLIYLGCVKQSYAFRNTIMVGTTACVFILLISLYKYIVPGVFINGQLYKGILYSLHFIPGFNFTLKIDPAGYAIAMVSSFLWLASGIYGIDYMTIEKKANRYNFFTIFSLTAQLGVLLAGDFLTLFLFFEGLVIFPYAIVAHHEDKESLGGANIFLYMSVATGLFLLFGIVFLYYLTGSLEIKAMGDILNKTNPEWMKYALVFFLIFGFGGKAGLFFEHAWLPRAHPVAPTPGSMLLSGVMIKSGAYGIFRSLNLLFVPGGFDLSGWISMINIGYVIIWIGILTMFLGVCNALLSENSKRMLAYHSVSQMGYIIMGIGCAAYLGKDGAMGLAGAIYHMINHALFKALLFMGVGAAYFRTHELNMYKLGGLWRNMPIAAIATMIAVFGIAGIPGFNGFASKTLLHHSILEAYEHSVHYSSDGKPDIWLRIAEIMFMVTAGGTFASNIKMGILTFFGHKNKKYAKVKDIQLPMKIAMIMLSGAILFIGLNPNWMLETVIGPALSYFNFDPASHPYHIIYNTHAVGTAIKSTIPILYDPVSKAFFGSSEVIHNILGGSNAILLGGIIFILGFRMGWFHMPDSNLMTVEFYYRGIVNFFKKFCTGVIVEVSDGVANGEVFVFRKNYNTFVKFCTGAIVEVSDGVANGEVFVFRKNYDAFSKFCTGAVVEVSDGVANGEVFVFRKNYDAFSKFCNGGVIAEVEDISPEPMRTPVMKSSLSDGAMSKFSEWVDKNEVGIFTSGYDGFTNFCRNTIGRLSYQINRLVLFLMVDIWLATSHTRSIYKTFDEAFIAWYGGELVIDKKLSDSYTKFCRGAANFDHNFIDGMVNGVAWFIHTYGRGMRRIQTGYIQNYALSIVIGILIILTVFLICN